MSDPSLFKWRHFEADLILCAVRWYLRYALSYRDVEELLRERGLTVDHTTIFRWVQRYAPELDRRCRPRLKATNDSYRVDETVRRIGCMKERSHRLPELLGDSVRTRLTHTRKGSKTPKGGGDRSMSGKAVREAKLSSQATAA